MVYFDCKDLGYFERIGCFGPYLECLIYLRKGLYNGRSPSRLLCFSEPGLIVAFFVHLLLTCKGINNSLKKMHMTMKLKTYCFYNYNVCILIFIKGLYRDISIHKFKLSRCLLWCLSVCLYPINVKTAEPIRPKF